MRDDLVPADGKQVDQADFRLYFSYTHIRDLPEATWANTVNHTENGPMTMEDWLDTYERHIPDHINQMQENYEDWLKRQS